MNLIFNCLGLVAAALLVCSCSKVPEVSPAPTPLPVSPPVATPSPVPVATPTPIVRHLAPEGVYFLMERISITTDSGIVGINPGTKLRLLSKTEANWNVTDGHMQFAVTPDQVTNDLDVANAVLKRDMTFSAIISDNIRKQEEENKITQAEKVAQLDKANKDNEANQSRQSATYNSPLDKPAYDQRYSYPYYPYYNPYYNSYYYNH